MNAPLLWDTQRRSRQARLARARGVTPGKVVQAAAIGALMQAVIETGDRVCLEGNNRSRPTFSRGR